MRDIREKQIISLLAEGLTTKEIAVNLGLEITTVETYRVQLLRMHRVKNTAHLISQCYKTGILLIESI